MKFHIPLIKTVIHLLFSTIVWIRYDKAFKISILWTFFHWYILFWHYFPSPSAFPFIAPKNRLTSSHFPNPISSQTCTLLLKVILALQDTKLEFNSHQFISGSTQISKPIPFKLLQFVLPTLCKFQSHNRTVQHSKWVFWLVKHQFAVQPPNFHTFDMWLDREFACEILPDLSYRLSLL